MFERGLFARRWNRFLIKWVSIALVPKVIIVKEGQRNKQKKELQWKCHKVRTYACYRNHNYVRLAWYSAVYYCTSLLRGFHRNFATLKTTKTGKVQRSHQSNVQLTNNHLVVCLSIDCKSNDSRRHSSCRGIKRVRIVRLECLHS